jgi:hypothetical protein
LKPPRAKGEKHHGKCEEDGGLEQLEGPEAVIGLKHREVAEPVGMQVLVHLRDQTWGNGSCLSHHWAGTGTELTGLGRLVGEGLLEQLSYSVIHHWVIGGIDPVKVHLERAWRERLT